jgi:ABC-2 type transport system permease protein
MALLITAAVALVDRRDFAAGLFPPRPGRARASPALGSPVGLAWRLQRGSVLGWAIGLLLLGAAYGSFADSFDDFVADYPEIAEYLGGAGNVVNSGLALTVLICALMAAAFGVASAMRVRAEETSGRAEPVLTTATSRSAWLASHLSVALVGSTVVLVAAGLGQGLAYGMSISDAGQIPA